MDKRKYILEKYDLITKSGHREAMDRYGFWLDPAETINMGGTKHYRVIKPHSKKGGWAPDYETPESKHIPPDAHINTLTHSKASFKKYND